MNLMFLLIAVWTLLPIAISYARYTPPAWSWSNAPMQSSGLAPDPQRTPDAVVQAYAARAFSWRGIFAVHTWIAFKRANESEYARYDVVGWGDDAKLRKNYSAADGLWYGAEPSLLVDLRGPAAEALIGKIEAAIASYPYKDLYRTWPGPNSNTFMAHVGREVPELHLDLPASAIGKDYRPLSDPMGRAPSGGGIQVSILGLAGVTVAPEEGIEFNLLSLNFGVDVLRPAIRLPAFGRLGVE